MLTQLEIDNMEMQIQKGKSLPEIYFVAHYVECREGIIDAEQYKSISKFKIIKIKINEIENAYFEYLKFLKAGGINGENYHVETEEEYYDTKTKYIHYYAVPNSKTPITKDINPRMPSIIYGYLRKVVNEDGDVLKVMNEPSPVKEVYTNELEFGDLKGKDLKEAYDSGKLDWKYMNLPAKQVVDGIEYQYVTSDWYILKAENFPRTEHILINTKTKNAYFTNLDEAYKYMQQLEA